MGVRNSTAPESPDLLECDGGGQKFQNAHTSILAVRIERVQTPKSPNTLICLLASRVRKFELPETWRLVSPDRGGSLFNALET